MNQKDMENKEVSNTDNNEVEEIVPFTQSEKTPEKPSKFGYYSLIASVILGFGVLGGSWALSKSYDNIDYTQTSQKEQEKKDKLKDKKVNKEFKNQVDTKTFKSKPEVVVDYSQEPFSNGYKVDDSRITYLNGVNAWEKVNNKESFLLYVGRPNCPYCHVFRQYQDSALKKLDIDIFGIDSIYAKYDLKLGDFMEDFLEVEFVPAVFLIEEGKVVKEMTAEMPEDWSYDYETIKEWFEENKI